jgi:hypothetical protein
LGIESLLTFLQEELKHGPVLDFKPIGGKLKRKQSANEILEGCGSKEYELFLHQNEAKKFKLKRKFSTESSSQHISK